MLARLDPLMPYNVMTMVRLTRAALRAAEIALILGTLGLALALRWLWLGVTRAPATDRRAALGRGLAGICSLLGATFVKIAQYLSTRPDLIHPDVISALDRVQDRVDPFPYADVWSTLSRELGQTPEDLFRQIDPYPVASASVAQVHRGVLQDGRVAAVKVLRPGVEQQVALDLALMRPAARLLGWIPALRMLNPVEVLERFGDALSAQLDLRIEAENNRRFAANFDGDATIGVPRLMERKCTRRVLCMEFIEGQKLRDIQADEDEGARLARAGFSALLRMVFAHGFVHADLHPGNMMVQGDRLVMVDLGLVCQVEPAQQAPMLGLMSAWLAGDVDGVCRAALALLEGDARDATPGEALRQDVAQMLQRYDSVRLATTSLGAVLLELLGLMRRHQLKVQPALTMVIVAMGIVEGVGRQLAPGLDLMGEARAFFSGTVGGASAA